jgi:integrase
VEQTQSSVNGGWVVASGHLEKRSKHGWTVVIDHGTYVDPVTRQEKQQREYVAMKNCTKTQAQEKLHEVLAEVNKGVYIKPSTETLGEYLLRWYKERCEPRLSPTTLQNYLVCIDKHLVPALGKHRLSDLQPVNLDRLYNSMLTAGAHPRTVEQVHQVLHIALAQAVRWMVLPRNIADFVTPPRPVKREMTALTPEQADALLATTRESYLHDVIVLALHTGMRRGELLALRWQDVDFE